LSALLSFPKAKLVNWGVVADGGGVLFQYFEIRVMAKEKETALSHPGGAVLRDSQTTKDTPPITQKRER